MIEQEITTFKFLSILIYYTNNSAFIRSQRRVSTAYSTHSIGNKLYMLCTVLTQACQ